MRILKCVKYDDKFFLKNILFLYEQIPEKALITKVKYENKRKKKMFDSGLICGL